MVWLVNGFSLSSIMSVGLRFFTFGSRPKVVIKRLENLITALVAIVDLDLLVLITDQFLNVDTTLTSHPQHDSALCLEL